MNIRKSTTAKATTASASVGKETAITKATADLRAMSPNKWKTFRPIDTIVGIRRLYLQRMDNNNERIMIGILFYNHSHFKGIIQHHGLPYNTIISFGKLDDEFNSNNYNEYTAYFHLPDEFAQMFKKIYFLRDCAVVCSLPEMQSFEVNAVIEASHVLETSLTNILHELRPVVTASQEQPILSNNGYTLLKFDIVQLDTIINCDGTTWDTVLHNLKLLMSSGSETHSHVIHHHGKVVNENLQFIK